MRDIPALRAGRSRYSGEKEREMMGETRDKMIIEPEVMWEGLHTLTRSSLSSLECIELHSLMCDVVLYLERESA